MARFTLRNDVNLNEIKAQFVEKRIEQLQKLDKNNLVKLVAKYELDLLDHIDRLLSDNPFPLNCDTAYHTLSEMEEGALQSLLSIDTEKEYDGLHEYGDGLRKE